MLRVHGTSTVHSTPQAWDWQHHWLVGEGVPALATHRGGAISASMLERKLCLLTGRGVLSTRNMVNAERVELLRHLLQLQA